MRSVFALSMSAVALVLAGCSPKPVNSATTDSNAPAEQTEIEDLKLHVPSPDWQDQIIYFVMTDRFKDGDPSNNDQGVGVYDPNKEHYYSGGDIQGIIDELDYIEGLGATAVWATPVILNQWKNPRYGFTGYGGYYGLDFSTIDPHNGTLDTYRRLSDKLHRRDMYLIKDIVVNHTAFLFDYVGPYNPENSAENFSLVEPEGLPQAASVLPPFDKFDRSNPDHAAANIYNWTPTITDYQNLGDAQFTHQLGGLADVNTSNPIVIDAYKKIYGDWISKAGVDAFRIDTVRYVEPSFFDQFMNDPDGILAQANATGREEFLAFGEVLDYSKPYENKGEQALAKYFGTDDAPILSSVISFPLKQDLKTVFAQGKPTAHLAYRLEQHMQMYRTPYLSPTLIDNHDVERFLASGSLPGFKQALATMFTIPGIPTIYQGTAQAFQETRQAMFAGGYLSTEDHFDRSTELYRFIASLSELRKSHPVLSRGTMAITRSSKYGPGILAYRRTYEDEVVDVLFNTSDEPLLLDNYMFASALSGPLNIVFSENVESSVAATGGILTSILPARAILVVSSDTKASISERPLNGKTTPSLELGSSQTIEVHTADFELHGITSSSSPDVWLIKNGQMNQKRVIKPDETGSWTYTYPVENLGDEAFYLIAYDPSSGLASTQLPLRTRIDVPSISYTSTDPKNDDTGPNGTYINMQHASAVGQKDILGVNAIASGDTLKLSFKMSEVSTDWLPPNGFDNVAFNIFFDLPTQQGGTHLPELNTIMPEALDWDLAHVSYGWGNTTYSASGATASQAGKRFGATPTIDVDKDADTITFTYKGSEYGVSAWDNTNIYIATWDIAGEGAYVLLGPEPAEWSFGGGAPDDPKILDDHLILDLN